ncbi:MAG: phosphatidylglycerophosphatase A [Lentisphaerae bacterium]|nr:phosphatidylglycerophosphatase A [Lentisphaerota bacterium]
MRKLILILATGCGLGYSPVASGTTGALLGIPLAAAVAALPLGGQIAAVALLIALAVPVCNTAENALGRKDDGRIVADEYCTLPLCLIGLPWPAYPWLLPAAFVMHRVMDIIKPPPARAAQHLQGGLGIVMDDVISSLYALAALHLLHRLAGCVNLPL